MEHKHEHGHEHEHSHEHGGWRRQVVTIAVATVLLVAAVAMERWGGLTTGQLLAVYLVPYLVAGWGTLCEAAEGVAHGDVLNEHLLMSIATVGALAIGFLPGAESEYAEAVLVMLLFQVGELLEGYAEGRSRRSIAHLMDLRPDVAHVALGDGTATRDMAPEAVAVGSTVVIAPGERVPIDGVVADGTTSLVDMSSLTGEAVPVAVGEGDPVASGCINQQQVLRLRTTCAYGESTVARILDLMEHAADRKSRSERFISRFARVYTPVVVALAVVVALLPPLLSGDMASTLATWVERGLMCLIVSCPCALVISVPLTFFGGIGGASRRGILIKGAGSIDMLARVGTVVFDKTGTLTEGRFAVTAIHPDTLDERQLLHLAAHVEHYTTHPIGAALREAFPEEGSDGCRVTEVTEVAGEGVTARVGSLTVGVGNERLMAALGATPHACEHDDTGTVVHVAVDGRYAGHIVICDVVKSDSAEAIGALRALGVRRTVMLTGDNETTARRVAREVGIDTWHAALLPADKVAHVERLAADGTAGATAFVGDGINDAPVLARADVGVAMGGLGSDAAIEAADVVLMDDRPTKVALAIATARHTVAIARQNVVLAIGVKVLVLLLAMVGVATMGMAVFADVGVTLLAVLNAMRAFAGRG